LGVLQKLLVSPTPRIALVLGKGLAAGLRALIQAVFIYILAFALGVHLDLRPAAVIGVAVVVVLGAVAFSIFSLITACLVRSRERFMGIGQLLTMPLFFASNAIYPIDIMPTWLKTVAQVNPLTFQVDALRDLMIKGGTSHFGLGVDIAVLAAVTTLFAAICAHLYPRLAR